MSRRPRRNHAAAFKAKMTLAAIKSEKTLAELAEQFDTRAEQVHHRRELILRQFEGWTTYRLIRHEMHYHP